MNNSEKARSYFDPKELKEFFDIIEKVKEYPTDNFLELVNLVGLEPASDFVDLDLSGADLSNLDLRNFRFDRADLSAANTTNTLFDVNKCVGTKFGVNKNKKEKIPEFPEGLVAVALNSTKGALVELNTESPFAAQDSAFQQALSDIAYLALDASGDIDALQSTLTLSGKSVADNLVALANELGVIVSLRRTEFLEVKEGVVASYMHNKVAEGLGKIGVLVALESSGEKGSLIDLGKKIAMHIAATSPLALNAEDVDPAVVEKERQKLFDEARESGKPENIIEMMVEGRMAKFYKESALSAQIFVMDGERSIAEVIADEATKLGTDVILKGFKRISLGEGLEYVEQDLVTEETTLNLLA